MTESLNYNLLNTIIFSGVIYGLVFSFVALMNKKISSKARTLLVITVLCLTVSNLQYWLIDIGFREKHQIPKVIYVQFELLILPFFYLFIKKYLQQKITNRLVYIVLLPFVLGMTYQFYAYSADLERSVLKKYNFIVEIATILYSLVLILMIFYEIYKYEKINPKLDFQKIGISTKWLKYTMFAGIGVFIIWILTTQLFYNDQMNELKVYYPLWIGISIVVYWIGNKGIIELRIYNERVSIRETHLRSNGKVLDIKKYTPKGKILFQQLSKDLEEYKLYLNPSLSLDILAHRYNVSSGYLSQIISKHSDDGLADLVNELRVAEAQKMLMDESFDNYTIESIALESGFNTKTNFYKVFKKLTGLTPNQYKKV